MALDCDPRFENVSNEDYKYRYSVNIKYDGGKSDSTDTDDPDDVIDCLVTAIQNHEEMISATLVRQGNTILFER